MDKTRQNAPIFEEVLFFEARYNTKINKQTNTKGYTIVFSFKVTPQAIFVTNLGLKGAGTARATFTLKSLRAGEGATLALSSLREGEGMNHLP